MKMFDRLFAAILSVLPHHLLGRIARALMHSKVGPLKNAEIVIFSGFADVDWSESKKESASEFEDFNAFFTRELKPGARPIDPDPQTFVSPCDGIMSECGRVTNDRILQTKNHYYTVRSLLANDRATREFHNGYFHTIYLTPRDYHRVHMPVAGRLQRMIHVPGRAFSVAPFTVRTVHNLFTRNERVVCLFETSHGPMAVVLVGAIFVSSIETVWAGVVTPPRKKKVTTGDWSRRHIELQKGEELGRFNMGSTVIVLFPPSAIASLEDYVNGDPVAMGQRLGRLR